MQPETEREMGTQLHWLFLINRQNNNDFKSLYMTSAYKNPLVLVRKLFSAWLELNKLSSHTNWCMFYDYNPREVHLNFAQNLIITTGFIGCILLPNFRVVGFLQLLKSFSLWHRVGWALRWLPCDLGVVSNWI